MIIRKAQYKWPFSMIFPSNSTANISFIRFFEFFSAFFFMGGCFLCVLFLFLRKLINYKAIFFLRRNSG